TDTAHSPCDAPHRKRDSDNVSMEFRAARGVGPWRSPRPADPHVRAEEALVERRISRRSVVLTGSQPVSSVENSCDGRHRACPYDRRRASVTHRKRKHLTMAAAGI